MQDKIILGLLSIRPMTIYELRQTMLNSTAMFYNTSIGSIHPACKKLLQIGQISCKNISEGQRIKKVYKITEAGRQSYQDWLQSPLGISKIKDELLLRIFFFADIKSDQDWQSVLNGYLDEVRKTISELSKRKKEITDMDIPDEYQRKIFFQITTLDFGYEYYQFLEKWLTNLINKKPPS